MTPSRVVTAVGIAVSGDTYGDPVNKYLEAVMAAAVLKRVCLGLPIDDAHAELVKAEMQAAKQRALVELGLSP